MRRWLVGLVAVLALLVAVPVLAETSGVVDPVSAQLNKLLEQIAKLQSSMNEVQKKTDELHKAVVGTVDAPAQVFVITADRTKPISTGENDEGHTVDLLDLREEKGTVILRLRLTTSPTASRTATYAVALETGRSRIVADQKYFPDVPPGTTREIEFEFKGGAGQLTPAGYVSVQSSVYGAKEIRVPLTPSK